MSSCPVRNRPCPEHGFIHGGEAEELRSGIEKLLAGVAIVYSWRDRLQKLLDTVDARDSLAFCERRPKPRKRVTHTKGVAK